METTSNQINLVQAVTVVSVVNGLALILFSIFKWQADILVILASPFIVAILLTIMFVWSFIHLIRVQTLRSATAVFVNVGVLLILLFAPLTSVWVSYNFSKYSLERSSVVAQVEAGTLVPDTTMGIRLNGKLRAVSDGGEVLADQRLGAVFFFTFKGFSDNYAGFVYIKDESALDSLLRLKGHPIFYDVIDYSKMAPHWYFITNT